MDTPVQLIVGLGNPGPQYEHTRHNAGADFVFALSEFCGITLKPERKFFGATARVRLEGHDVWLLLPDTYMNLSGKAVTAIAGFYQIPPEAILIAHDELDQQLINQSIDDAVRVMPLAIKGQWNSAMKELHSQ